MVRRWWVGSKSKKVPVKESSSSNENQNPPSGDSPCAKLDQMESLVEESKEYMRMRRLDSEYVRRLDGRQKVLLKKESPLSPSSNENQTPPTCDSPYFKAKIVQWIDKEPSKAIPLFWCAINSGDEVDNALKDMAIVMKQLDRADEAIEAIISFRHLCSVKCQEFLAILLMDLYKDKTQEHPKKKKKKKKEKEKMGGKPSGLLVVVVAFALGFTFGSINFEDYRRDTPPPPLPPPPPPPLPPPTPLMVLKYIPGGFPHWFLFLWFLLLSSYSYGVLGKTVGKHGKKTGLDQRQYMELSLCLYGHYRKQQCFLGRQKNRSN